MRLLTAIFLLICCPGLLLGQSVFRSLNVVTVIPIHAPVFETGCSEVAASGSVSTCSLALVGSEAIAVYLEWAGTSTATVTDSTGQVITPALSAPQDFSTSSHIDLYYLQNATAGTHTILVSITPTAVAYVVGAVAYTGAATTGSLIDGNPTGAPFTAATNPFTCPAITTTQTNGVLIGGAVESSGSIVINPGTGFTSRVKPSPEQMLEDKSTTTVGSYAAAFSTTTTTAAACVSMVFKHA